MDYHNLMKQRIANAWRDSKPLTPVVNDAQPVQQDRMATMKQEISTAWKRKQ